MSTRPTAPTLEKSFKQSWIFAMALGAAIGWGAFILPYDWMFQGGLAGTLIGFAIGGTMIAIIALSYGYTIRHLPVTGGGVAYAFAALGKTHAFIVGWALVLGYVCIVALNASAVTLVFRVTFPSLFMRLPMYQVANWTIYLPEVIVASLFIVAFAWMNSRGTAISGRFQFWTVVLMLFAVVVILLWLSVYWLIERPAMAPAFPAGVAPLSAIFVIVAFVPWAYVGFDSIPQLAGEFDFSPRRALKLLMWGIVAATLVYCAMMVSTAIAIGDNTGAYEDSAWPPAEAISKIMGPFGLVLMAVAVTAGVLTGLNGFFAAASRVLFVLGRSGLGPRALGVLSHKFRTPKNALVCVAALALISPWFGRASLSWVVDMSSVGITVAYFYACFCAYKIASGGVVRGKPDRVSGDGAQAVLALLGCALAVGFLGLLLIPGSPGLLSQQSLAMLVLWAVVCSLIYVSMRKSIRELSDDQIEKAIFR